MKKRSTGSPWCWLSKDTLRERQANRLRAYLRDVVVPFSPYYRALFEEHRIDHQSIRSLEDLERIPLTSKNDLLPTKSVPDKPRQFILQPDRSILARRPGVIAAGLFRGRDYVTAEDLEALVPRVFAHRVELAPGVSDVEEVLSDAVAGAVEGLARATMKRR